MRILATASLTGLLLATPAASQAQNVQQLLGGLLTGNQTQDKALRDAYERGYRHGREDEARLARGGRDRGDRYGDDRRDDDAPPAPYRPRGPGDDR